MTNRETVEIPLDMSITVERRYLTDPEDPSLDAEDARNIIDRALEAEGGPAHGLLVALGWRKPDDY